MVKVVQITNTRLDSLSLDDFWLVICFGFWWNQSKTMRISKEPPGMSKTTKKGPKREKGWLSKETAVLTYFLMFFWETQVVLDSSHGRVTYETDQRQKGLKRSRQERPKRLKKPKGRFSKEKAVLTHFFMVMRETQCVLYSSHVRVPLNMMRPIRDNEDRINIRKIAPKIVFILKITLLALIGHFEIFWRVIWSPHRLWLVT